MADSLQNAISELFSRSFSRRPGSLPAGHSPPAESGNYILLHTRKGKEFDEVIIWEELFKPILWDNAAPEDIVQHRLLLRVAATRARSSVTFLTPASKPCVLL